MSVVAGTENFVVTIAENLGLSTKELMSFKIIFEPNNLVTVEAKYFVHKQGLKETIDILTSLPKKDDS